ncbi:hypothetical protein ACFQ6U_14000 [Streptomyces sp. NPDC056465]|uniref:hypothetical protein n=1 Tax=unclassified Streptomyces TaxID=2593676 RepID=UPI0035D93601
MLDLVDGASAAQIDRVGKIFLADKVRRSVTFDFLQDKGPNRHLWVTCHEGLWFEVVTWPGCLTFHGTVGGYVFRRFQDDILSAFQGQMEPDRWAGFLANGRDSVLVYAGADRATGYIRDAVKAAEEQYPDLAEQVEATFFSPDASADLKTADGILASAAAFEHDAFRFDTSDWDLYQYDARYLYACHAVAWAVEEWNARRPVTAPV